LANVSHEKQSVKRKMEKKKKKSGMNQMKKDMTKSPVTDVPAHWHDGN